MSYKVIHYFTDLQDFNHAYKVGDDYPRLGLDVSEERLKELSSKNNKQGKPLIQKVKEKNFLDEFAEKEEKSEIMYTKTEINRMSASELKELAKRKEILGSENMTGAELKKVLIEFFNL